MIREYLTCCKECGYEKYPNAPKIMDGITIHKGTCPFCNQVKMLIPASDWSGKIWD